VADIQGLLAGYLQAAEALGVEIRCGTAVRGFETKNGRLEAVVTDQEPLRGETFINAAGAWARKVGEMAGALPVPLRPCRRHLFLTPPLAWVDPEWPFVWDVTHDIYFRPEAGGLLLSPCDQDEMDPGIPHTDARIVELLSEKVRLCCPSLVEAPIKSSWAGLRTLSADGRFVIGWDPRAHGFFWVAGLGGHGVTASAAVGALSASLILGGPEKGTETGEEFSPKRFAP
jgi:D-arginine dehydrogenase